MDFLHTFSSEREGNLNEGEILVFYGYLQTFSSGRENCLKFHFIDKESELLKFYTFN